MAETPRQLPTISSISGTLTLVTPMDIARHIHHEYDRFVDVFDIADVVLDTSAVSCEEGKVGGSLGPNVFSQALMT